MNSRIETLEKENAKLRRALKGERIASPRVGRFEDAIWHAQRGDVVEALFALSTVGPEFLPFADLSEKVRAAR